MKKALLVIICLVIIIMVVVFAKVSHPVAAPVDTITSASTNLTQPADQNAQVAQNQPTTSMDTSKTQKQSDGLAITVLKDGQGVVAKANDKVTVNYTGSLTNGTVFDSNVDPKFGHVQPFTFTLGVGQVIRGWDEGVLGMKVGEKRHLVIPAELGYGARGAGASIPPNATLQFDVEVTGINQ